MNSELNSSSLLEETIGEYRIARRELEALAAEAVHIGDRLERLGRTLRSDPAWLFVGAPDHSVDDDAAGRVHVVAPQSLPSIQQLASLTAAIRQTRQRVESLRERLVLMGCQEVVEEPGSYFQ
jgi:hypothetical protein